MMGECEIITFDKKSVLSRIKKANEMRTKAHELMLQADVLLDEIQKELIYGKDA